MSNMTENKLNQTDRLLEVKNLRTTFRTISGEVKAVRGASFYVTVELNGQNYEGVMVEMKEEAGNRTMCFTAAGDNNETIWGVHYFKQEDK